MPSLPTTRRPPASVLAVALVITLVIGACGGHRDPPETVVGRARARTLAARQASVTIATSVGVVTGRLQPSARSGTVDGRPIDLGVSAGSFVDLVRADPYLAVDLVEGRTRVSTYGGAEVQGTSAFQYDLDLSPAKALSLAPPDRQPPIRAVIALMRRSSIFASVVVDGRGRLLRIQLPTDPNETRPGYLGGKLVAYVTVDLHGFQ